MQNLVPPTDLKNIVRDLNQIEDLLATVVTVGGTVAAVLPPSSQSVRILGAGLSALSMVLMYAKKITEGMGK